MKVHILHIMIRVGNIDRSIDFYTRMLDMTLLRRNDYPDGQLTLIFVGYGSEVNSAVIEPIHNWGVDAYKIGTDYGYIAVGVGDTYQTCDNIHNNGGQVTREIRPTKHGTIMVAFVTDPDGHKIELIQKSS